MAQQINFYDPALRLRRDLLTFHVVLVAVCASMLAVAMGMAYMRHQIQQLQAQAGEAEAALQAQQAALQRFAADGEALRPDASLIAELNTMKTTLDQRLSALRMLRAGRFGRQEGHSAALLGIARQHINGLWLTGVVLDGADMALRGRALSPELIPSYVGHLNDEPVLQGRSFRALNIERPSEEPAPFVASASSSAASPPAVLGGASAPADLMHPAAFVEFSLTGSGGAAVTNKVSPP